MNPDRKQTQDLAEALREAAGVVGSTRTLENLLKLVTPGVYVQMNITVSRDPEGRYKLSVTSATHGTKCNILLRRGLQGGQPVDASDFAALKQQLAALPPAGGPPRPDPRCPDDWKD